jgi:hypothetical protein
MNSNKNNGIKAYYQNQNVIIEASNYEQEVIIYNILGKEISKITALKPDQKYSIDFSSVHSGIYLIKSNDTTLKLIKP